MSSAPGGANSMMGSAKEMVGSAVGSNSMTQEGKQQHAEGETEKKTAQTADAADGLWVTRRKEALARRKKSPVKPRRRPTNLF
ncbi:hypothetical protein B0H13DRAFT_2000721, partial [Mycena leptocephala]